MDGFEVRRGEVRLGAAGCAVVANAVAQRMAVWGVMGALQRQVGAVQRAWAGEEGSCWVWAPPVRA